MGGGGGFPFTPRLEQGNAAYMDPKTMNDIAMTSSDETSTLSYDEVIVRAELQASREAGRGIDCAVASLLQAKPHMEWSGLADMLVSKFKEVCADTGHTAALIAQMNIQNCVALLVQAEPCKEAFQGGVWLMQATPQPS